jgi:hypothetical protein
MMIRVRCCLLQVPLRHLRITIQPNRFLYAVGLEIYGCCQLISFAWSRLLLLCTLCWRLMISSKFEGLSLVKERWL